MFNNARKGFSTAFGAHVVVPFLDVHTFRPRVAGLEGRESVALTRRDFHQCRRMFYR